MERINAETIVGITLVTIALIFIFAATMNNVWAIILPADYLILALGVGFIALGVITIRNNNRKHSHEESTHH